jgi:hypothetical protein
MLKKPEGYKNLNSSAVILEARNSPVEQFSIFPNPEGENFCEHDDTSQILAEDIPNSRSREISSAYGGTNIFRKEKLCEIGAESFYDSDNPKAKFPACGKFQVVSHGETDIHTFKEYGCVDRSDSASIRILPQEYL